MMAVVDVQEHVDRHGRLTGWAVVSWDGYAESSVFVGVHKGEPDTPVDLDAQDEWCAWAGEREKAKRWAADVWGTVRRETFQTEVGDIMVGDTVLPPGTIAYADGNPVGVVRHEELVQFVVRVESVSAHGGVSVRSMIERFPIIPHGTDLYRLARSLRFTPDTLARKRQKAVRKLLPGDELWELVFAWPEDEWESRWGMFIDGVREDRWGWGDGWVRTGDHLAAADWKPPVKLSRDLVPHIGPTGGGGRIDPPSGSVIYPERA